MPADRVFGFTSVRGRSEMESALGDWIMQPEGFDDSRALPAWREGDRAPLATNGYPFVVDPGMRRDRYLSLRAAGSPMFCVPIALDAARCVVLTRDARGEERVVAIGRQFFPPAAE